MTNTARYTVLDDLGNNVEVRRYESMVRAQTRAFDENQAFMELYDYINGGNEDKKQMAMTTPVIIRREHSGVFMAFILPASEKEPPKPASQEIELRDVDPWTIGAISFEGIMSYDDLERETRILENTLAKNNIDTRGESFLLQYDRPGTPPLMRKTEIAYEIIH